MTLAATPPIRATAAAHPIQFWHQNAVQTIAPASGGRSVLNYLRRDCALTGTKEGCAEGDCGACCVMTVAHTENGLVFESVNACIHPVANLHGKALLSVEDLGTVKQPHPVQTAMVDAHASQCGFCTPGFVMSLAACTEQARCSNARLNREQVLDAISGNLCRCTGYKPIIEAGLFAAQAKAGLDHGAIAAGLARLNQASQASHATTAPLPAAVLPARTLPEAPAMLTPRSIAELNAAIAAHPQAVLTAGLTDVGLWLNKQLRHIPVMISTVQMAEFQGIHHTTGNVHAGMDIGAAVTLSQLAPHLLAAYPELHEWLERFASVPVRNAATLGGNVVGGSPIGDSMPVLLALDAQLLLQRGEGAGSQRMVALKDFYLAYQQKDLQPGEFLRRIIIPKRSKHLKLAVYKISKRFEDDISAVCAALAFEVIDGIIATARLGFGGVAATPIRAYSVEAALQGKAFTAATLQTAAPLLEAAFTPLSDHRASSDYRRLMCGNALRRAAAQWFSDEPTRVYATV